MVPILLVASLWMNAALVLRLLSASRELRKAISLKDELMDVNASLIRESVQRGEVIQSLRQDSRLWRKVAGFLSDELQYGTQKVA